MKNKSMEEAVLPYLSKPPWVANEKTRYAVKFRDQEGKIHQLGTIDYVLGGIEADQRGDIIRIKTITHLPENQFKDESELTIRAFTYEPLTYHSQTTSPQGPVEIMAEYLEKKVKITYQFGGKRKSHKLKLAKKYYDNAQVIHMIRAADLDKLDLDEFQLVNILNGRQYTAVVSYQGDERISVPAGEFGCSRFEIKIWEMEQESKQIFLYSKDYQRLFIKNVTVSQTIELLEYKKPEI